jgi:tetrahydromethanopterin S-methyltransferase subunit G
MPIDPIEFGKVIARLDEQDRQIEKLNQNMEKLLAMANQGKGGLLTLTSIGAVVGAVIAEVARHLIFSGR